jgi:serine/threonine-protein kinase
VSRPCAAITQPSRRIDPAPSSSRRIDSASPWSERPTSSPASSGVVLGDRYRLEQVLRRGGMGDVYRAYDMRLDIEVAVKLVRADLAGAEATERLIKEARALAHVSHPSAVRVIDVGATDGGDPYLVMELLRGTSLDEALAATGPFTPEQAVRLLLPIVDAAAAAHAAGIVHRDIKPQNIVLVAGDDHAPSTKLVDFGVARLTGEPAGARLTQAGKLVGSLDYMAPEQTEGRLDVDAQADVWALCVVLFELVTGTTPFRRPTPLATLTAIQSEVPRPASALRHEPELWDILRWGLAKDRAERWSTARELGQALAWWAIMRGIDADAARTSLVSRWGAGGSAPPGHDPGGAPSQGGQARPGARRTPCILVADDDPLQRETVSDVLRDDGYEVVEAADGDEVLKLLGGSAVVPDVLLLDFCMPGFSGLGVLRLLQRRGKVPPTLILTGFPDNSVDRMAVQLGAVRVLHKPVDIDVLRSEVRAVLPASGGE